MTERIVVSEPLPMPTGPPPRGPWTLVAILGAVGVAVLIAIVALTTEGDGRDHQAGRRPRVAAVRSQNPRPRTDEAAPATEPETTDGSESTDSTTTSDPVTTPAPSSTGPVISYLTAPLGMVCDPGETVRPVDVTVRAERVTALEITGPEPTGASVRAPVNEPTIVTTLPIPARCSGANDFRIVATGTDGSTVERHVTVLGRVRPKPPGP